MDIASKGALTLNNPLTRFFAGLGSIILNAHRYYNKRKDQLDK